MLVSLSQHQIGLSCYDCGRDYNTDAPAITVGARCPAPECDSNHQPHCNAASTDSESGALCLCDGITAVTIRANKSALSDTGMIEADYALAKAQADLVNDVLALDGTDRDSVVLQRMYALLSERIGTVIPGFMPPGADIDVKPMF